MKALRLRPELATRDANSSRFAAGGRYDNGRSRFFRATLPTVGRSAANPPRALLATHANPVDGFQGRADISLGRSRCRNTGRGSRGRESPWSWSRTRKSWSRVARGHEMPFARWFSRSAKAPLIAMQRRQRCPRGVCGGLEAPPARCAWCYHAHLVLAPLASSPFLLQSSGRAVNESSKTTHRNMHGR